jgi:cytochrome c
LAARLIVEEALEGEAADALGREYDARGAAAGSGYRNGHRTGRLKTAEGAVEYSSPQIADRAEPFRSKIRAILGSRSAELERRSIFAQADLSEARFGPPVRRRAINPVTWHASPPPTHRRWDSSRSGSRASASPVTTAGAMPSLRPRAEAGFPIFTRSRYVSLADVIARDKLRLEPFVPIGQRCRRGPLSRKGYAMLRLAGVSLAVLICTSLIASAQDADKGKSQFAQCRACHTLEQGKNAVGPNLFGVVGRKAASVEKFAYSKAMKEAGEKGLVWDEANLLEYLADPGAFLKKQTGKDSVDNKMPNKFPNEELRKNIIAFLKTVK